MQLFPLRLIPVTPDFNFIGLNKIVYGISIVLLLGSITCIAINKFNFGIDFIGGISMEVRAGEEPDLPKMRTVLSNLDIGEVILQNFGTTRDLSIRVGANSEENLMKNIELIKQTLSKEFPYDFEYRKVDFVGPQVGEQMIKSGTIAMILSFAAIMLYVWVRFEWQFGVGALIALLHDIIISLGFMSITNYDFNLSTIAAILTIIGYSVNDSVVIYDRIRDNFRKYSKRKLPEIINMSINETLSRTSITSLTTLLANLSLVILGGEAIYSFSILVFFGIFVGTYSSIFISAPILTLFNFKE
jgi:preprotein translocase subunit SecF